MSENLYEFFRSHFESNIDRPFLSEPGARSLTYRQVDDRSAQFAGALNELGCAAGDRVVVQVEKSTDAVALYFACLRSGVVYVPLNTAYTAHEIEYFLTDTGAALFVCDPGRFGEIEPIADSLDSLQVRTLGADRDGTLADAAQSSSPRSEIVERASGDLAAMLYTSGTTGRSKGAMLTHEGLRANGLALHQVWAFEPDDVLLHTLPIFHVHGLFVALHCAILNSSEVIFCRRFATDVVLSELPRATVFMGVPTHYVRLLADNAFNTEACRHIRLFTSGSAPMTEQVFAAFTEATGHKICERYGMTECGIITSNPYDGDRIAGTVGYALPGYEIRVSNESGSVSPGETGVVEVRGAHLFAGYWNLPDKTAEEMTADGFFRTGDVGALDSGGRLTLAGRSGDMIISGGYNVYPKEIETVLDDVEGVIESAVVGLPHADFGEGVVAFVVIDASHGQDTIVAALAAACQGPLARFKHPKSYIALDQLPRNTMGKVQKSGLRAEYAEFFATT